MKSLPNSWKPYFLVLSILLLTVTVISDQYRPIPEPEDHVTDSSHNHGHTKSLDEPSSLDKAFSHAPDSGVIPVDPEKEHRMAIFHYNEGNKFLNKENWKEAVENYKMALHHDKGLNEVYINMSNAYLKAGQYEKAKKTLDALKIQAPKNPHLYYNLACYYSLTRQEATSLDALQHSIRLGYKNHGDIHTDPDLANLRKTADFKQWVKTL